MFDTVTLTFDLGDFSTLAVPSAVVKLYQISVYGAIHCEIIAISIFDLMTLNMSLGSGIIFAKFELYQAIHS